MKNKFNKTMEDHGRKLWLIETSGMSDWQKENQRRVLAGLPEISEQQFLEQENYYK